MSSPHSPLIPTFSHHHCHEEKHFQSHEIVRDLIIGISDGLTVPFALSAGLSALQNSKIIITAGLAEILAGSVSMGLGGYLAGRSEIAHYDAERERELREVREIPEAEVAEIIDIFRPYGISVEALTPLIEQLKGDEEQFVNFMMKFELNLERPSKHRSWISALTIGISYLLGGFVPLMPYFFCSDPLQGLVWSSSITLLVLLIFGYIRARVLGIKKSLLSSIETMLIGAAAALVSWQVARLVSI